MRASLGAPMCSGLRTVRRTADAHSTTLDQTRGARPRKLSGGMCTPKSDSTTMGTPSTMVMRTIVGFGASDRRERQLESALELRGVDVARRRDQQFIFVPTPGGGVRLKPAQRGQMIERKREAHLRRGGNVCRVAEQTIGHVDRRMRTVLGEPPGLAHPRHRMRDALTI